MNLKAATHPELVAIAQDLLTDRPVNEADRVVLQRVRDSRTLSRNEKRQLADLTNKYRYQSNPSRFT